MGRSRPLVLILVAYAALLLFEAATIPLKIPEILQMAAGRGFQSFSTLRWIALSPDSAPLNYFVQLPFLLIFGYTRLGVRLDSVLFAVASGYWFYRLARRLAIPQPLLALSVFLLVPFHLQVAALGRPFEQALFLLLVASEYFLRLVERPVFSMAALYAALLTLCIYTDLYMFLPAIGYVLVLFRFVNHAEKRRAMWFALPATVVPILLFVPYYFWATPQRSPYWPVQTSPSSYLELGESLPPGLVLWFSAAIILLVFYLLGRISNRPQLGKFAFAISVFLILLCVAGDCLYWTSPKEDLQAETALVTPELAGDACVVFVSERFAKVLFEVFAPDLKTLECVNFSHQRVVLASHPYVRHEQQEDAESFFRGLNFHETKRIQEGGGQIVVMQQYR